MTTGVPSPPFIFQGFTGNGALNAFGFVATYQAGTTTPIATYTDATLTTPNQNPVPLNAIGQAPIWLTPGLAYKFIETDSGGNQCGYADNVPGFITVAYLTSYLPGYLSTLLTASYLGDILYPQTANETAAGVTPLNFQYPEGYFLRYIASWTSGQADTGGVNSAALNNATTVAAHGKNPLILPAGKIEIASAWNCSAVNSALTGTNGGLTVIGQGVGNTSITYAAGQNNIGNAWDCTALSYGYFKNFTFVAGSFAAETYTNCPQIALLLASGAPAATPAGPRIFSIDLTFKNVQIAHYGDFGVWNAGAEQIHFQDCLIQQLRPGATYPSSAAFVFVAAGSSAGVTSAFSTVQTTVTSMTDVVWDGAAGGITCYGTRAVLFHFTAAGALADIWINGYFQSNVNAGTGFAFMVDDSNGAYSAGILNCGGDKLIMENRGTSGALQVCSLEATLPQGLRFIGHCESGTQITAAPFTFAAACVPTNCYFDWGPNDSAGGFNIGAVVACLGAENGIFVRANVPAGNLATVVNTRTIGGYAGVGVTGMGDDYSTFMTSPYIQGTVTASAMNLLTTKRAGARVSINSDWLELVQTTAGVTTSGSVIATSPTIAAKVFVTGKSGSGPAFFDEVNMMYGISPPQVINSQSSGVAAARTYSVSTNQLTLTMASGTYAVQASVITIGIQA